MSFTPTVAGSYVVTGSYAGDLGTGASTGSSSAITVKRGTPTTVMDVDTTDGAAASLTLHCGTASTRCTAAMKITTQTGGRTVTVASGSTVVTSGSTKTLRLTLNSDGRRLLAQQHFLVAYLTVTVDGRTIHRQTVRFCKQTG